MSILTIEGSPNVPDISDEELQKRYESIKPIQKVGGKYFLLEECDLRKVAYLWAPKHQEEVKVKEVARIKTHHHTGYISLFKPSIAEVLTQIPPEYLSTVHYFEVIVDDSSGTDTQIRCFSSGTGHLATTVLYMAA